MKGGHGPTKELQDLNWGAFDHASHAPQLRSCDYYVHVSLQYLVGIGRHEVVSEDNRERR